MTDSVITDASYQACELLAHTAIDAAWERWTDAQALAYRLLHECGTDTYVELAARLLDLTGLPVSL